MTKPELLALMRLLSALESWGFSNKQTLPDYLLEDIQKNVEILEREILTPPGWAERTDVRMP